MPFKVVLLLSLVLLTACTNPFNPRWESKDNGSSTALPFDSPVNLLYNLETSYRNQDIDLYSECLADSFRFELIQQDAQQIGVDMDGDGVADDWWGRQQEIEYHRNLFTEGSTDGQYPPPDAIDLDLQFSTDSTAWLPDYQSGHEGWVIIQATFYLKLTFYSGSEIISSGRADFYCKKEDSHWYIAVWRDVSAF